MAEELKMRRILDPRDLRNTINGLRNADEDKVDRSELAEGLDQKLDGAGGTVNGDLDVVGTLSENGDRVYSAGNMPAPEDIGAAPADHDHDGAYAAADHTHTAAQVGAAPADHDHDGVYSPVGHGHDGEYAELYHDHDGVYASAGHSHTPTEIGAASESHLHTGIYSPEGHTHTAAQVGAASADHDHEGVYAAASHSHSGTYAAYSHSHTAAQVGAVPKTGGTVSGSLSVTGQLKEGGSRVYSPNNKPSASDVGALSHHGVLRSVSLNSLTEDGFYGVATSCTPLPISSCGVLIQISYDSSWRQQIFKGTADESDQSVFVRGQLTAGEGSNGSWSAWKKLYFASGTYAAALASFNADSAGEFNSATASGDDSTALGVGASVSECEPNTIALGNSELSSLKSPVSLTTTSDERDKTDILPVDGKAAVEFLCAIEPITYVDNRRDAYIPEDKKSGDEYRRYGMTAYDRKAHKRGDKKGSRRRAGVMAGQVARALAQVFGTDNYANIVDDNFYDIKKAGKTPSVENKLSVAYERFIPFLIAAIQQLKGEINELRQSGK